uniref:Uncharacterized protein n=1 Tax=Rousettus aegyptiacus TaxID=9407 RepID=A0A7J8FII2_ROUAE|nr:hypothetical protein HJG63_011862 [Rousettus aegyptiacus]
MIPLQGALPSVPFAPAATFQGLTQCLAPGHCTWTVNSGRTTPQSVKEQVKSPVRLGEPSVASSSRAQSARVNGVGANQAGVRLWTTRMRSYRTPWSLVADRVYSPRDTIEESCWPMTTTDGWDTVPDPLWKETESTRIAGTRHPWGLSPGSVPCQRWDLERAA